MFAFKNSAYSSKLKNIISSIFIYSILIFSSGCSGTRPDNLGVNDGKLAPCPSTPNCVCSQSDLSDIEHFIQPFSYSGSKEKAKEKLLSVIMNSAGSEIIKNDSDYIHVEFTTLIMRFKDDIQFYFDDSTKVIHFKSASRLGSGDLGVNRKRMENIRSKFME